MFVTYRGITGGLGLGEQLRLVFVELHVVTIRDSASFANTRKLSSLASAGTPREIARAIALVGYRAAGRAWSCSLFAYSLTARSAMCSKKEFGKNSSRKSRANEGQGTTKGRGDGCQ